MTSAVSKVFRSGNSEAVRLPREVAYGENIDVVVERHGDVVTIYPKPKLSFREALDIMRTLPKPSSVQEREPIEFPERPGL
jgi:antitoxin VapB